jgi:hypothetical protein
MGTLREHSPDRASGADTFEWDPGDASDAAVPERLAGRMRRKSVTTVLLGAIVGALLAGLAPAAAAGTDSRSGASPGNRGWETGAGRDADDRIGYRSDDGG